MEIAVAFGSVGLGLVGLIAFLVLRLVGLSHQLGVSQANQENLIATIERMGQDRKRRRKIEKFIEGDAVAIRDGSDADLDGMLLGEGEAADNDKSGITISTAALDTEDKAPL